MTPATVPLFTPPSPSWSPSLLSLPRTGLTLLQKANGTNASAAAAIAASSTGTTPHNHNSNSNAAEDSDAERLNKKHRASSFVPENATPTPAGLPPVPIQPTIPTNENGTATVPQDVRQAAEAVVGITGSAAAPAAAAPAESSPGDAVALPGLETSLPVGEITGLASAVTNGGPQNEAAIMAGENGAGTTPTVSA